MSIKLHLASLFTLGLLSGLVFTIILSASYLGGFLSWPIVILAVIAFNFFMWLVGPYISDYIYKFFYKIEFYDYEELKEHQYAKFMKQVCDKHKIKFPRIGIIKDQNPTAFTYGSAAFNARIVFTEGLFNFLEEEELEAVAAHELGHIINKDFIIMTIAATLVEVLYVLYVVFTRSRAGTSTGIFGRKAQRRGNYLVLVGFVSLFFYWIATYILLFLSRLREYYADEFSAKETGDSNLLSAALIKIAYGIAATKETEKTARLLNTTRSQGIFDFKAAKDLGLVCQNTSNKKDLMERALLFDIVNPWAWILQLKSTHPLVGKRIKRLSGLTESPVFEFENIIHKEVDRQRLWKNFFTDFFIANSTKLIIMATIIIVFLSIVYNQPYFIPVVITGIILLIIFSAVKIKYRFPLNNFNETSIINCMADIYASPVRGNPVKITGKAIGRGKAGFIFGEDMIFQDKTGFIYLNYESAIPLLGNLFFAWKKLETLLGKPAVSTGWFLRGNTHHLELYNYKSETESIQSYVRFWAVLGAVLNIFLWSFVALAAYLILKFSLFLI